MKNKKYIYIIYMLLLIFGMFLLACDESKEQNSVYLESPNISNDNGVVSWKMIDNAYGYNVYLNDELMKCTQLTKYIIETDENIKVYVTAVGNGKEYLDSPRSNIINIYEEEVETKEELYNSILEMGSYSFNGTIDKTIRFGQDNLIKDESLWRLLENVFKEHRDNDGGYSAEFWGKLLRGGVLTYEYTLDYELYTILETTVKNILTIQSKEIDGRLSGFDCEHEFTGWDLRSRSYNLLGLEYFYSICKDNDLKNQVIESLCKQTDYIMKYVGKEDGKIDILLTSPDWGGCTSSNLLEGVTRLYGLTNNEKYRVYAKYIIDSGGSSMLSQNGNNIVEDCLLKTPMYLWGCRKFYEVSNFMEGILQYYLLTNDDEARKIAESFYEVVSKSEITEDGGVAIDIEEACNSLVEQCDPERLGRMQETCAGVVWVKFCCHLFSITGNYEIMDNIEKAYYNYFVGIMDYNLYHNFPYFSYSPVGCTERQDVYSGTAFLDEDTIQSCCVISGASAMPTISQYAVTKNNDGFLMNLYIDGQINTEFNNQKIKFICETGYPQNGKVKIIVSLDEPIMLDIAVRIPNWSQKSLLKLNGISFTNVTSGYYHINKEWKNGDTIELEFDMRAYLIHGSDECSNSNGKYNVVVKRGPIVFARDYRIEGEKMFSSVNFIESNNYLEYEITDDVNFEHQVAIKVKTIDGDLILADYGSCGKTESAESIMELWIPTIDYYSQSLTEDVVVKSYAQDSANVFINGKYTIEDSLIDLTSDKIFDMFAWRFIPVQDKENTYLIYLLNTNDYLTVDKNGINFIHQKELTNDGTQYFQLSLVGLNRYKIKNVNGKLMTIHGETKDVYLLEDISHELQYWFLTNKQK